MGDQANLIGISRLLAFVRLVRELRATQKSGGKGYNNPTVAAQASSLERRVDAEVASLLHVHQSVSAE